MPVLIWGNGGCANDGAQFGNFLMEVASHGYLVLANGAPKSRKYSSIKQMTDGVDWVLAGKASKYGDIDSSKIASSGQSCGGLQAYSVAYHDERIKQIMVFNSGLLDSAKVPLLSEIKVPVSYFLGGPKDIAYSNVSSISREPWFRI
jgi:dienelactone hydrolase